MPSIILETDNQEQLDAFLRDCPDITKYGIKLLEDKPLIAETQATIKVLNGKKAFAWNDGNAVHLIIADDSSEAFCILFADRLRSAGAHQGSGRTARQCFPERR